MPHLDEEGRRLRAKVAAHTMHARTDKEAVAVAAREGLLAKFEVLVDPDGKLDPKERTRRATQAFKADRARIAFEAHKAKLAAGGVL